MKITVVGAGSVGATCTEVIAKRQLTENLILLDIKEGLAEGKAIDLMQTASLCGFETKITGCTNDYAVTKDSHIAIITSGIPRKPGMTREELIGTNAKIVQSVTENILKYSPNALIIVVSNPMDTMTYLTATTSKLPKNKVIGMGGILDSSRFKYYLSQALGCASADLQGVVIGGHGDTTMIPLTRLATYNSSPAHRYLSAEKLEEVKQKTMVGGATLTKLIGTSAWYAPGAAVATLVESITRDQKKVLPCSVLLDGEYGLNDICIGVPVVIGKDGWEKVIDFHLDDKEMAALHQSATAVRKMNAAL